MKKSVPNLNQLELQLYLSYKKSCSMTTMKLSLTFLLLVFISQQCFSQDDPSKYFDDGGISDPKFLLKAGYNPIDDEKFMAFEFELTNNLGLECGLGLISNARMRWMNSFDYPFTSIPEEGNGVAFWVSARYHFNGFFEKWYLPLSFRVNQLGDQRVGDIVVFGGGYQIRFAGKWIFDAELGFGPRIWLTPDRSFVNQHMDGIMLTPAFPFRLKIGYEF